MILLPETCL